MQGKTWDKIGIGISAVCVLHCLFIPLLLALLPLLPFGVALHQWTHPVLFLLIMPTVWLALRKNRQDRMIKCLFFTGLSMLAVAWLLHDGVRTIVEMVITLAGSIFLISGHWLNYKNHKALSHQKAKQAVM